METINNLWRELNTTPYYDNQNLATSDIIFKIYYNIYCNSPASPQVCTWSANLYSIYIPLVLPLSSFCLVLTSNYSFFKYRFKVVKHKLLAPYISTCNSTHFNHKREREMGDNNGLPLFVTKSAKGRILFQLYAILIFVGVCLIFLYRMSHIPKREEAGRWAWIGLFLSELWFSFYWFLTTFVRLNPIYRYTFKDRLSLRYIWISLSFTYIWIFCFTCSVTNVIDKSINRYEKFLPSIDIFVCTADPTIEPPAMVINTVLSVMAYDYPPEKLSVYLSDDGGSVLTFYAMLEASRFSKIWLPFCKKFKVEPRSPEAYFRTAVEPLEEPAMAKEWTSVKVCTLLLNSTWIFLICKQAMNNYCWAITYNGWRGIKQKKTKIKKCGM